MSVTLICFRLGGVTAALGEPDAEMRLVGACRAVDRTTSHPEAEAQDRPTGGQRPNSASSRLEELIAEAETACAQDRGRGLIEAAQPRRPWSA